ncbi:hypothetical protein [Mycobacterium sp.]
MPCEISISALRPDVIGRPRKMGCAAGDGSVVDSADSDGAWFPSAWGEAALSHSSLYVGVAVGKSHGPLKVHLTAEDHRGDDDTRNSTVARTLTIAP